MEPVLEDTMMRYDVHESETVVTDPSNTSLQRALTECHTPLLTGGALDSNNVAHLIASLNAEPVVNAARVLYFKAQVQMGTYEVDSTRVAQCMAGDLETA